jgi:hypothetical protein
MKVDEIERTQKSATPVLLHESTRKGVAAKRVSIVGLKINVQEINTPSQSKLAKKYEMLSAFVPVSQPD